MSDKRAALAQHAEFGDVHIASAVDMATLLDADRD